MTGIYREEQLGQEQPSPWDEEFMVGGRIWKQRGPCSRKRLRDAGEPGSQLGFDMLIGISAIYLGFET